MKRAAFVCWDYLITMGCGDSCPRLETARRKAWAVADPKAVAPDRYAEVRDAIRRRVQESIECMKDMEPPRGG